MPFDYEQSIWGKGEANLRWSDPTSFRLRQALAALADLPPVSAVLEVGCGAGQFIRAIKKIRPELVCHGCDISAAALAEAKSAGGGVIYALNGTMLPYGNGSLDAVLIFDVLEHVEDPDALLREIRRILKPGGIFYCFVPCEGDGLSLWHALDAAHLKHDLTRKYAGHINYFSRRSLFDLIKQTGFTPVRIRYSEHVFGQLLGVLAFWLMGRAARRRGFAQVNNETYFTQSGSNVPIKFLKDLINSLVYLESAFWSRLPSPNVHLTVKKSFILSA